ncbi:MAG TPA: phosphate signaling complex protein PhoU [Candidatus Ornithomonoglobus merdipullorum]|mgnify:CR=1 FL=1|uniref:Phosphate-specific transport system accessory protein PhoU n=1 Tax=Candidatus Ornithomonoglobus merdipullorum TaxID=2840895 RepID=A0A9D1MB19_9FIRM|nr:phosphate signaling complex protein PhoU [Candidatus Ornithomonoglobus merdipullorum]
MRNKFDEQLSQLNTKLTDMCSSIEQAISGAVTAITKNNKELAKEVIDLNVDIHDRERDIETLCLKLLLQQQPVARDLRTISAALKMITDMRRIGTQAADICEIYLESEYNLAENMPGIIREMTIETIGMVNKSIDAFIKKDLNLAIEVGKTDAKVDELFMEVKNMLIESIKTNSDGSDQSIDILMIAKYLEKIGDHANNIAEWVAFSITGEHRE